MVFSQLPTLSKEVKFWLCPVVFSCPLSSAAKFPVVSTEVVGLEMSLRWANWETCSERFSFFSCVHVSAQEVALACTSVHTRSFQASLNAVLGIGIGMFHRFLSTVFLASLEATKKKTYPTPSWFNKGKKVAFPTWVHPGSWRQGSTSLIVFLRGI